VPGINIFPSLPVAKWNGNASRPDEELDALLTVESARVRRPGLSFPFTSSGAMWRPKVPVVPVKLRSELGEGGINMNPLLIIESAREVADTKEDVDSRG